MPEGTPEQYYRQVAELITSDPTIKWNASQLAAGTITSIQQVQGTPVTTFNLNTGMLITNLNGMRLEIGGTAIMKVHDGTNTRLYINLV